MNKVYKVIWNHATQTWVAVSEIAQAKGKTSSKTDKRAKLSKAAAVVSLAVAGSAVISGQAYAATTAPASTQYCLQQGGVTTSCADYNVQSNGGNVHVQGAGTVAGLGAGSNPSGWGTSIGADSTAGAGATALGYNAEATGTESSALGANTVASGKHSLAIGSSNQPATAAEATAERSVAVGHNSSSTATDAIAMGTSATASGASATALGRNTTATKAGAIAIGNSSVASGEKSTAIGDGAKVLSGAVNSTAIGTGSTIQGTSTNAYSLGTNNSIGASNAAAVGSNNVIQPSASNTMVLGNNITATKPNSVILGEGSTDGDYKQVTCVTIPNIADGTSIVYDGFNGTATGVVSIGSKGKERQLTNVAPGEISANSTDTINGSQLYAVAYKLGEQVSNTYFHANLNEANQGAGDPVTNKGRILDKAGATGAYAVTAGVNSTATAQKATAVGYGTKASGMFATALGVAAEASAQAATAIGTNAVAKSIDSIALGNASKAEHQKSIAIGDRSHTTGEDSMAIGAVASASAPNAYAIGSQAVASGVGSTAIGSRSNSSAYRALAIGAQSLASGELAVAFGQTSQARGASSLALGSDSRATEAADSGIAVGNGSRVLAANATAIGRKSIIAAGADNATAVGANSAIMDNAQNAQAFGASNTVASSNATVIGARNLVKEDAAYSSAVGNDNTITSANTFVLGSGIGRSSTDLAAESGEGTVANSVYLGNESEVTKGAGSVDGNGVGSLKTWNKDQQSGTVATTAGANGTVETAKVGGVTYGSASVGGQAFAGAATTGAVSVGSSGAERRIQNVAAGEISKTSTDAINGSQLYAVAHQASKPITFKANSNKDGANATMNFASENGLERILGDEIVIKGASTNRDLSRNSDAATTGTYSARNVQTVVDNQGVQIQIATNPIFDSVQFGSNSGPKITNEGANIKVGDSTGAATKITNVANGTNANDAVNLSQLNATRAVVAAGDNTHITAEDIAGGGKTYTVHADKAVVQAGNGISLETNPATNGNGTVTTTYTVKANVDDTTIGITQDGKLYSKVVDTDTNTDTSAHVKAADGSLVTVTKADATRADGITQITDYTVDITKGAFNGVTTAGKLNADGTTAGVATVGDVITAVNSGFFTVNANGSKAADIKFGDTLNFANGTGTTAVVKDGGVAYNTNVDGTTIVVDGATNSLKVNTDALPKTVVAQGNNTVVSSETEGTTTTYTVDAEKTTVSKAATSPITVTEGAKSATGVTNYEVGLSIDDTTLEVVDGKLKAKSVEKVVLDDTVTDNIATVNTESGAAAGNAGETYKVGVSKAAVKTAAKEAINVTGTAPIAVTKTDENGVDTYNVTFDGTKAAESIPLTYKANGGNAQTVNLNKGLDFTNGDKTVATVGADGVVTFDLNADAKAQLAKVETVIAGDSGLVTVDDGAVNTSGGKEFKVDITKGAFNGVTTAGKLNADGTTAGVATVGDVITAVNSGFFTVNANGSKAADIKFGDTLNFANGTGTTAVVKDGGVAYNTNVDGTTIVVDGATNSLKVNTDALPKTVVAQGNNTVVSSETVGTTTTYKVDAEKTTVSKEATSPITVTEGIKSATGVTNYEVGLSIDENTLEVVDGKLKSKVVDTDTNTDTSAHVKAADGSLVTVTKADATRADGITQITDYTVDITKGAFNGVTPAGKLNADGTTAGVATVADVVTAVNSGFFTVNANGSKAADIKFGDTLNFANGTGTTAVVKDGGVAYNTNVDGTTIVVDGATNSLKVNTDALPKTVVAAGNNTNVASKTVDGTTTYTIDAEKTVVTTGTGLTVTPTPGANNVTTYNVELDQETQDQIAKVETVVAGDSGLVTVDSTAQNISGGKEFKVDIAKGTFNNPSTTGELAAGNTGVATVADVVEAVNKGFLTTKVAGNQVEQVGFGDDINFVDGKGTTARIVDSANGDKGITFDANLVSSDNSITIADKDGAKNLTVNTGDSTVEDGGKAVTTDGNQVANLGDVVETINNTSWKVNSTAKTGGEGTYTANEESKINAGDTLNIDAGKNIKISGAGNTLLVETKDNVTFEEVTTRNLTANGDTVVKNFTVQPQSTINMGDNQIKGVAEGTDGTDAVNVDQLKREVATAKAVEKVTADTSADNIATVTPKSGKPAGEANEEYVVSVSKAAVKDAAKEAIEVVGDAKAITVDKTDVGGVETFKVNYNGAEAAKTTPLTYKANGGNAQTVNLSEGLNFTNGDKTVATVGVDGKVSFDLSDEAKEQLAKEESVSTDTPDLLTVTKDKLNDTKGQNYKVDVVKGTFNAQTANGALGDVTNTNGVATVADVVSAVNTGYWTAKVDDAEYSKVKFGDSVNFVDGAATNAKVGTNGITFDVKTDGTTIKVDNQGNLAVNTDGLASTEVVSGKNTTVTPTVTGNKTTYKVDATKTTVTAATDGKVEITGGTEDQNGVINYTVGLDAATKNIINNAVVDVVDTDTVDLTKTADNKIQADVKTTTLTAVAAGLDKAGQVNAPSADDAKKLVNAQDLATVINNSGWNVKGDVVDGGVAKGTHATTLINPGETVTLRAGKNLALDQATDVFTYSLQDDISLNSVTTVDLTATGATTVNDFTVAPNSAVDMGGNTLTNVGSGGDTDSNGANIGDIKRIAAQSVEKVVLDDTVADNIATVNTGSGKVAGEAGETYKVGVSKAAVKTAAKEAINVTGSAPISVAKTDVGGVDTYNVTFDGTKAAESIPLTYKANGENPQTVNLNKGLNFTNGDKTVATVGADGVVTFDLNADAKAQLAKVETVVAGDSGLVTVDSTAQNTSGGKEFKVDIAKGTFNNPSTTGELAAGNTGVATVADVVEAVNKGFLTTKVGGNQVEQVGFGDDINFVNGTGTTAKIVDGVNGDKGITFDVKTDGTTIKIDDNGNLAVNTTNLPKTKLVDGKNTTVEGSGTDTDPYKVNVQGDLTDITSISNGGTTIKLGDATVNVGGATISNVKDGVNDGDAVNVKQLKASKEEVVSTDGSVKVTEGTTVDGAKKFDLSVTTDGTTITKGDNGELKVNVTPLTVTNGVVDKPAGDEANKLATAGDIANAINNSGFTIKANGDTGALVKPGDEVDFVNGKNISITRSGTSLTVATVDTPVFTSVQFNENGPIIKADASNNINVGKSDGSATKITNVAAGVDDNDAVNVKQLQDTVAANKTAIKAGNNVDITGEGTTASPYVINAKDTTATASVKDGSSEFLTVTANGTTTADGTTTTDYAVGLTDKAKEVLNNAATKVEDTNTVDLTLTNGVLKADVKAVDGKGTTANVTTNGLTFDIKTDGNTITFDKDGNLTVNTTNLPKTKLVNGKNTTVEGSGTDADPYKVNVQGDLTDITSISNGGTTIKLGDATVNVGGATISNVKAGVEDGDAVNVKQLQDTVAAAKTYVQAGDNTEVTGTGTQADPYTVHAVKTTASAGSDYVTVTAKPQENHTTNYSIDLSQDTKDKIEAATKANTIRETVVAGSDNVVVKADKTNATGGKEFSVDIAKDINVNSVNASAVTVGDVKIDSNGINAGGKTITNVDAGVNATDAVNVSQLTGAVTNINNRIDGVEGRVNELDSRVRGLGAISAASSSLPQVYLPGKSMVAVAAGGYGGAQAVAVGFSSTSDNGRLLMKIQGSASTDGDKSGGVGVGWMW